MWRFSFVALALTFLAVVLTGGSIPLAAQSSATTTTVAIGGPGVGMVQAGDGNFYSPSLPTYVACADDPTHICSYIFRMNQAGTATVFHPFDPAPNATVNADGLAPTALIVGTDGNLYGACKYGGLGGLGTIFEITLKGDFTILKTFNANGNTLDPGYQPLDLVQGNDGNFYFTNGLGIYELTPSGTSSTVTTLYTFPFDATSSTFSDGGNANSMVQGSDGNFYLTLLQAPNTVRGQGTQGAIAKFNPATKLLTVIHPLNPDGSEGNHPDGPLVEASNGAFYGIAEFSQNTSTSQGIAFTCTPGGSYSIVHQFPGGTVGSYSIYESTLTLGSDGNLYGTTLFGGDTASKNCTPNGCGTIYQMATAGTSFASLHSFEGGIPTSTVVADNPQVDGASPATPLVQTGDGSFYGTTLGGTMSGPTVFKTSFTPALDSPIQLTLDHSKINTGDSVNLTWKVVNAFSLTAQQCGANIVGSPVGAGTWSGPQSGTMVNGVYTGGATITPTAGGTFTYGLTCGGHESGFVTLAVVDVSPLEITTQALQPGTVSQRYSMFMIATGGVSPYQWSIGGTQPKGLNFNPNTGELSGIPLQYGVYHLAFGVQDSSTNPLSTGTLLDLTIVSGLIINSNLPNLVVGKPYSQALSASGGLTPYTWKVSSGTLPPGLQLNTTAGVIGGTPTDQGQSTFTIQVSDAENPKDMVTKSYTLTTATPPLAITTDPNLPDGGVGLYYSTPLSAEGGQPPYFWSFGANVAPNIIPPGLSISLNGGILSGTPSQWSYQGHANNFSITVTDSSNPKVSVTKSFSLNVKNTLQITVKSLPNATVGVLTDVPLTATGGVPPYTWFGSSIPSPKTIGIYLENGDTLEFDPLVATTATVTLEVQDSEQHYADVTFTQQVTFLPAPLPTTTLLTSSNTAAGVGESLTLTAKVTPSSGVTPTGQVFFYNGTTSLGNADLDANGNATLQTSFATIGVYNITAAYTGNGTYAASTSSQLTETIIMPGVTATVSPVNLTIQPGSSGQLIITVTPIGGFTGKITFTCGTLPKHVSCTFSPASLTISGPGPFTDTLTVSTKGPLKAYLVRPSIVPDSKGTHNALFTAATFWLPGSLASVLGLVRIKRRGASRPNGNLWMIAILLLAGVGALSSCGGTSNVARPGTYTIPIELNLSGGATQNINATVVVE